MKTKYLFLLLILVSGISFSQVTNEGQPTSWTLNLETESIQEKLMPSFDMQRVASEDAKNDGKQGVPWRFGHSHTVDLGLEDGTWTILENGDRVWRMLISSPGAISLNFIFDDFYMPEGGNLYLYSDDREDLLGAYTSIQNQDDRKLGTWLVYGDKVWLEYYEPQNVFGMGNINISNIIHGYRNADKKTHEKDLNDSGDCMLDVDCDIGADWQAQKEHNKRSAALLLMNNSLCSGALINNTANDGTPFFLTADHCIDAGTATTAVFRFGWISPTTSCATPTNSQNGPQGMTVSGSTLRASDPESDFALLEINQAIPPEWDRVYAGWDRSGIVPDYTVSIHHPSGDVMKVSRDNQSPGKIDYNNPLFVWEILQQSGGWEYGVTEGGSSGSPLFDNDGRIIGQLYGGSSQCSGLSDNGASDIYGRVDKSWGGAGTSSTRLSDWLDPSGTGQTILNSNPTLSDDDLAILSIDEPESGNLSDTETITVTIQNNGNNSASNFDISYQINGGALVSENYSNSIDSGTSIQYSFNQTVDMSVEGNYEIIATVSLTSDEIETNNSLTLTVENIGGGDCPEDYDLPIVWQDNFECHDAFAIANIGDWIIVDNDGGTTWGANAVDFTNEAYVGSGIIYNQALATNASGSPITTWDTYEGNQGLYFFSAVTASAPNDDWMISPEFTLDGVTSPQLTFWAKSLTDQYGLERISVYVNDVNTSNPDPATFIELTQSPYVEVPIDWTQYQFDLSAWEGSSSPIRIALHYQSNDAFVLQVDSFKVEGTLGLEEFDDSEIEYYYNRISKDLDINSMEILDQIQIFNLLGQEIISNEINSMNYRINLSNLSNSIYIVSIKAENKIKRFKIHIN
tara:strand:+ start:638 stop:3205 length:2568 start_codon:yes stop_codon:yes gene_type:complete